MAKRRVVKPTGPGRSLVAEIWGLLFLAATAFAYLARFTSAAGEVGARVVEYLYKGFGYGAMTFPLFSCALGLFLVVRGRWPRADRRLVGVSLAYLAALLVLHWLRVPDGLELVWAAAGMGGGLVGGWLAVLFLRWFGPTGRFAVGSLLALVALLLATGLSLGRALGLLGAAVRWAVSAIIAQGREFAAGLRSRPGKALPKGVAFRETHDGRLIRKDHEVPAGAKGVPAAGAAAPAPAGATPAGGAAAATAATQVAGGQIADGGGAQAPAGVGATRSGQPGLSPVSAPAGERGGGRGAGPAAGLPPAAQAQPAFPYELPPLSLLRRPIRQRAGRAAQDAETRAQLLEDTFSSFGVGVKVMEINPGPVVTRFEVRPAPGVKVSRIEALAEDVALGLAAADVRIAPIPGKGLVGVEVPNSEVSLVLLREVLESPEFARSESRLTVAIGKDIAGDVIVADLQRMVHMLIAGATGSGKSVCLNALIASLLYKASPSEVKLLLIDPKVVELQVFDGIPHLLAPVIIDPKKASRVLRWAVREMEDRYYRFSEVGARNIADYNRMLAGNRAEHAGVFPELPREPQGWGGEERAVPAPGTQSVPHIVIVIDELADLMMVAPVEVETSIWRLAQMARAAGIHLVVATQRPSVNVITGVIKANIQSRIAFAVASQVDSRTILDMGGAEKLLGRGDMLFYPVGASRPRRVQGALITDREVEELVRYVKRQGDPTYMDSFPVADEYDEQGERELDARFADALRVVFDSGQASTSMLQRRLRVGYTRAARMVDMMEEMGVVGKSDGVKPRDVLMTMEQYVQRYGPLGRDETRPR